MAGGEYWRLSSTLLVHTARWLTDCILQRWPLPHEATVLWMQSKQTTLIMLSDVLLRRRARAIACLFWRWTLGDRKAEITNRTSFDETVARRETGAELQELRDGELAVWAKTNMKCLDNFVEHEQWARVILRGSTLALIWHDIYLFGHDTTVTYIKAV